MTDDIEAMVAKLHDHLVATAELPIEREASRWIGEAEAIADDLVGTGVDRSVVHKRVAHVVDLLEHVEETGNQSADEHIEAAKTLAERTLEAIE